MKVFLLISGLSSALSCLAQAGEADSAFYQQTEARWLKSKMGTWQVVAKLTPQPGKPAMALTATAERKMIGAFCLQETMIPDENSQAPHFTRIAYFDFNRNDKRWDYVSIDTRITAGIMSFVNYEAKGDSIVSYILNFPHPGFGPVDRGKNVRVRNVFRTIDSDHETVNQYWMLTDGPEWLAVSYAYTRRK